MVTGKKDIDITPELILSKISEADIFYRLLGNYKIGEMICNSMRGEKNPSCLIIEKEYGLRLRDFGASEWNGDCWDCWGRVFGLSLNETLRDVYRVFQLEENTKSPIITWKTPNMTPHRPPPLIQWTYRPGTRREYQYWDDYYQGEQELKKENIFFPRDVWINKKKQPQSDLLTYIYWYESENSSKIYKPHGKLGKDVWYQNRKWMSNLRFDYIENLQGLEDGCEKSFGATSKKDRMFLSAVLELDCMYNIQGENIMAFNKENIDYIKSKSDRQYFLSDGDKTGTLFGKTLEEEHNFISLPPPGDAEKDYAAWGLRDGVYTVREFFKKHKIIN